MMRLTEDANIWWTKSDPTSLVLDVFRGRSVCSEVIFDSVVNEGFVDTAVVDRGT